MRQEEATRLNDEIYAEVCEKGVPIDIRTGSHVAAADWIRKLLTKHIKIDTPIGVIDDIEYDFCPNCRHVFVQGKCTKCLWDGSRSPYVLSLSEDL